MSVVNSLRVLGLTAIFGTSTVFADLHLDVASSEIVALLGPSGCGKSTLLRLVAGLDRPSDGRIEIGREDVTNQPPHKRSVGLVFQDGALFPHLNARDNISYGLKMQGRRMAERHRMANDLLALVGLNGFGDRSVGTLSGGEQQRIALARALAPEPRVLLLDEPFASLDESLRNRLGAEVAEILRARGTTAVIVTHDPDEAARVGDRVVHFADLLPAVGHRADSPSI